MRGPFALILRVVVCLVVGIAASGLSACAWKLARDRPWLWRTASTHPWLLACLHRADAPSHPTWRRDPPFEAAPTTWRRIRGLGYRDDYATWGNPDSGVTFLEVESWGLPLPCLEMSAHGSLGTRIPTREDSWESERLETSFPLRPIWRGAAIDAIFFSAGAWYLISLAGAIRRRRRRLAGLCTRCTYDRKGLPASAVCPECGTPAPKQKRSRSQAGSRDPTSAQP